MKKGLHPDSYRLVVFKDMSNGHTFLSRSTTASKETIQWEDGKEYPLVKLEISNTFHPFLKVRMAISGLLLHPATCTGMTGQKKNSKFTILPCKDRNNIRQALSHFSKTKKE